MTAVLPASLFVAALGLGAVVAYQAFAPVSPLEEPAPQKAPPRAAPADLPVYAPPPESQFAVINARPLFDPARQPVTEPEAAGATSVAPPTFTLIGVAIASRISVALLKKPEAPSAVSVPLGQSIDGWKLVTVGPDFVVLRAGVTDVTIKLRQAAGLPQPKLNAEPRPDVTGQPGQ